MDTRGKLTMIIGLVLVVCLSGCGGNTSQKAATGKPSEIPAASEAAMMLKNGDVWTFRGEESFIRVLVQDSKKLEVSVGNPYLSVKAQSCDLNPADEVLSCTVVDTKGSGIKMKFECKENKFFATIAKTGDGSSRSWGPIPLQKNAPAASLPKTAPIKQSTRQPKPINMDEVFDQVSAKVAGINGNRDLKYVTVRVVNRSPYAVHTNVKVQFDGTNARYSTAQFIQPSGSEWARNLQPRETQEIMVIVPHSFTNWRQVEAEVLRVELAQ